MPKLVVGAGVERFDGRRGRSEDQGDPPASRDPRGHVARVVARRAFLLVGAFMLLVDAGGGYPFGG